MPGSAAPVPPTARPPGFGTCSSRFRFATPLPATAKPHPGSQPARALARARVTRVVNPRPIRIPRCAAGRGRILHARDRIRQRLRRGDIVEMQRALFAAALRKRNRHAFAIGRWPKPIAPGPGRDQFRSHPRFGRTFPHLTRRAPSRSRQYVRGHAAWAAVGALRRSAGWPVTRPSVDRVLLSRFPLVWQARAQPTLAVRPACAPRRRA